MGLGGLRRAEALGKQGDYTAGINELEFTLKALPGNTSAQELLIEFKKRETAQIEKERQERLSRPKAAFDLAVLLWRKEAELFEDHEVQANMAVADVERALLRVFANVRPFFKTMRMQPKLPESFEIVAEQEVSGGLRRCVIGGAQTGNKETIIHFKVLEYRAEHKVTMQGLLNFTEDVSFVALDPARAGEMGDRQERQLEEGIQGVTERIRRAVMPFARKEP